MADKYSTIQQHQPLRVPQSFDKQGKALVVQLDEIFDDIYRRFGRLKVSDFGGQLKDLCLVKDEDGKYISIQTALDGIETDIHDELGNYYTKSETSEQITTSLTTALGYYYTKTETASLVSTSIGDALGNYYTKTETASQISSSINTALGDYSTTAQTATAISLAVGNCYGKVSLIDIKTTGIEVKSSGSIKLLASDSSSRVEMDRDGIDIYAGSILNIYAGGSIRIKDSTDSANLIKLDKYGLYLYTGGVLEIDGGSLIIGSGTTMTLWSGGAFNVYSGSSFTVNAGGAINFTNNNNDNVISLSNAGIDIASSKYVKIAAGTSGYWKYDNYGLTYFNTSDEGELQIGNWSRAITGYKSGMFVGNGVTVYSNVDANAVLFRAKDPTQSAYKTIAFTVSQYSEYDSFSPLTDESVNLGVPSYAWSDCYVHYVKILGSSRSGSPALYVAANTNSWLYGTVYYDTLTQNSSKDIKHDIQPMPSFGSKIDQLQTVSFVYDNDKNENRRYGLIYEDTLPVFPEICTRDESSKAINYIELVPMLVKEIQELRLRMAAVEGS